MEERERVCIISFDETSLSNECNYDKGKDMICDPKKKVQCVILRRLCGKWKQLIYYNFDQDMTENILLKIITAVEACGYPVVAIVNDLGPTNVRLWNNLGICMGKDTF